jgi:hypothetical protein
MCSLFQNEELLKKLIAQGAVGLLVSLSHNNDDPITGEWCAFALYNLASNPSTPIGMIEGGILPCLIKLCHDSTSKTKQFCAAAFSYLTQIKEVDPSEAIPILVHMLRNEEEQKTKTDCASSLYNIADSDSCCDLMLAAGALIPIVRLTQADYMLTKIKCAAILSRLSLHHQYYGQFARDDVLRVLLDLAYVDHALTQRRVVIALSNLSQSAELRRMLLSLDATPHRIKALASKPDEYLRRGCSAIICNLAYESGSEKELVRSGIVSTLLITALVTSDQVESKKICVKALMNLMADQAILSALVKDDVIWGLSNLASEEDHIAELELSYLCAIALCYLSPLFPRAMLKSGGVVKTILHFIDHDNIDILRFGCRALTNMLYASTLEDDHFRQWAVQNMSKIASTKDSEISEMCILCLCIASQSESCRTIIVSMGMLQKIDASAIFAESHISQAYLTMFGNIANNPQMRSQLLDDHSVDRYIHLYLYLYIFNACSYTYCFTLHIVCVFYNCYFHWQIFSYVQLKQYKFEFVHCESAVLYKLRGGEHP